MMTSSISLPSKLLNCRKIFLRDYEIWINIGVHEYEKKAEQRVIVNVELYVDQQNTKPKEDKLSEVVDYDLIRKSVMSAISKEHVQLQETLIERMLEVLLTLPHVQAVSLSTEKPDIYPDCRSVGIEVFRFNPALL